MMDHAHFSGKLALQQRVLTSYRAAFFEALAQVCEGGLSVCAGLPRPEESIAVTDQIRFANFHPIQNRHLLKGRSYLCYQRGLPAWLEACNPDALIVEANPRYLSTPAAIRWMKKRARPVLGWGLGARPNSAYQHFFQKWGERPREAFRNSFVNQFDALLTYSRRGAQEYAALGFPAEKIFVAPNAATGRPTQPMPVRPAEFDGKPKVLFVGRLQARKRVDLLLQACAALPAIIQPELVIVGDGPEREGLEKLAKTVYPSAEFPGAKHGAELADYFCAADLFVLPGTGGLAVQEAMSYGLPIIMGQGDGTNDDLVRSVNGWQIRPDDLFELTNGLRVAASDSARLRAMGAESYRIVKEEINLESMVGVFVEALNTVR
jgi:glycosyltransferase involved in cell wall biosynthesis